MFSFLNLAGLFLGVTIPLLVLAYLKRPPENRKKISSLILLKDLPSAPRLKKKIKLPLRFYLELLALLAMLAAICQPIFLKKGDLVAVLLDNSMSMAADDRLSRAIDKLADSSISKDDRFRLFTALGETKDSEELSFDSLVKAARETTILPWSDSLQASISKINGLDNFASIIVLTDKEIAENLEGKVKPFSVSKAKSNNYLSSISLKNTKLTASAIFNGEGSASTVAKLSGVSQTGEEFELEEKEVLLNANQTKDISFSLSKEYPAYSVQLLGESIAENALENDDKAWVSNRSAKTKTILLISPEAGSAKTLGLEKLSSYASEAIKPEAFAGKDLTPYSLLIFHQTAPKVIPKINSLFILPPKENLLFKVKDEVRSVVVSSFDENHSINSYLKPWLLGGSRGQVFSKPLWAEEVLSEEGGALVLAGESSGIRLLASGIELLPFEAKKTPTASVLFLNMLSWLRGEKLQVDSSSGSLLTGARIDAQTTMPSGEKLSSEELADEPGIYRLENDSFLVVNAFYPEESNTFRAQKFSVPELESDALADSSNSKPIFTWFLLAAMVVMIADFLLRFKGAEHA